MPKDMVANRLPPAVPMPNGALRGYDLYLINKQFEPSAICHKPLYFSDTMLSGMDTNAFHTFSLWPPAFDFSERYRSCLT